MAGKCVRLWSEHEPRTEQNPPEILRADLTQLVLECAEWGATEIEKLDWLTPPSESAWNASKDLLENLDCLECRIEPNGTKTTRITEKGKAVLRLGLHPRLACVALVGGAEAVLPFSEFAEASAERQKIFVSDLKRRLKESERWLNICERSEAISPILAGFPDRLARLSSETEANADRAEYQFPSGRKAWLLRENLVTQKLSSFPTWLVVVEVDAGERTGKIYSFEPLSDYQTEVFLQKYAKTEVKTEFVGQANGDDFKNLSVQKKEITSYGAIVLKEKKLPVESEDFALALCDLVQKKGLNSLPIDSKIEDFLIRTEFYIKYNAKNSSELKKKFDFLAQNAEKWLRPFVKSQKINAQDIFDALYWYFDGAEIDSKVPPQITLPNGRKRKIKYERQADGEIQPSLEIIIQQIFGCFETPKILGKAVLLKLLSPASRPLQITDDLEHFWTGAWIEICKEMKGRYPKHNWDYRKSE